MYLKTTAKSQCLMRGVDFHVILPYHDGAPEIERPYPTLYFLPGFSCNGEEIIFALPLRQMATQYGIAVVVPDGENLFYTDHPERAASMGQYAGKELMEITRKLFPCLSHRREDTFIAGISMGGYGAAVLGLHYEELYSKILLFSPAVEADSLLLHQPDMPGAIPASMFTEVIGGMAAYQTSPRLNAFRAIEAAKQAGKPIPPIWMCCGEEDLLVRDACKHFDAWMEQYDVPHQTVSGHGDHDYIYWDAHLEEAFRFLGREPRF